MVQQTKNIIALGVTGSVGTSFLRILQAYPQRFFLTGFSYHTNFETAKKIQEQFQSRYVCCTNNQNAKEEVRYWQKSGVIFLQNMEELLDCDYDTILTAVVGSVGVRATYKAVQQGKKILLANKETLVMAGDIIMQQAREHKAAILPVDSEHSSVFRLLGNGSDTADGVAVSKSNNKIILTASGGPFRDADVVTIANASKEQVLAHPTWDMGHKISVDSAGMVNKALEIIEAHHLFAMPYARLTAVIHPQSYVHAIVQASDGSFSFHVSEPDMIYPIAYALFYPQEAPSLCSPQLNSQEKILALPSFQFKEIKKEKFPLFFLGVQAAQKGGAYPAVFNAANEEAVKLFLQDVLSFTQIPVAIEKALERFVVEKGQGQGNSLSDLFEFDAWARKFVIQGFKNGI